MNNRIKTLCRCALFSAIICIFSIMTIPIAPVPFNLALFGIILSALLLPVRQCAVSVIVYIALGAAGLPVFAGMQGGFSVLIGPTGGFILGYLPCALCISLFSKKDTRKAVIASAFGCAICYICGSAWYSVITETSMVSAVTVCVVPFIPWDVVKITSAVVIEKRIRGLI